MIVKMWGKCCVFDGMRFKTGNGYKRYNGEWTKNIEMCRRIPMMPACPEKIGGWERKQSSFEKVVREALTSVRANREENVQKKLICW